MKGNSSSVQEYLLRHRCRRHRYTPYGAGFVVVNHETPSCSTYSVYAVRAATLCPLNNTGILLDKRIMSSSTYHYRRVLRGIEGVSEYTRLFLRQAQCRLTPVKESLLTASERTAADIEARCIQLP